MSEIATRVAKNTGYLYLRMSITVFVSLYTTRLVLNSLGDTDYGIFSIVGGTIALLGFFNASLSNSTQRFMSYAEGEGELEKKKYVFNISVLMHFALGLAIASLLILLGSFFFDSLLNIPEERIEAAIVVYSSLIISTTFTVMSVPYEAVLNAHENMKYFAVVGILESLLKLIVALICVYTLRDKLIIYGILMACIPVVILIVMRIYCHYKYDECVISPRLFFDRVLAYKMISFAGWSFLNSVASMTTMQGMAILLNIYGGVIVNTAHGIANQLSGQLMSFSNTMLKALNPVIVKSCGAGSNKQMLDAAQTGNKFSYSLYAVFAIPFIIETPYILHLWLDLVPEWSVLFVRLVLLRLLLSQMSITFETCVAATGVIRNMNVINSIIWISPLVFCFILYEMNFPIYTIYVLLILMVLLRSINTIYFCKRLCGLHVLHFLLNTFLPCCIVSFIVLLLLFFIHVSMELSLFRLLSVIIVGILSFILLSFFIIFDKTERNLVFDMFKQFKNRLKK